MIIRRPKIVKESYLWFLDDVRDSGLINMFGAARHLREMFDELTKEQSRKVLLYWMESFGKEDR